MTAAHAGEIAALLLVIAGGWFWYDSLRAREAAIAAAREACGAEGVLLLDDTVALAALRVRRDDRGTVALLRVYRFEFSDTGNNRLDGSVALLGADVHTLYLEPHGGAGARPAGRPGDMAP